MTVTLRLLRSGFTIDAALKRGHGLAEHSWPGISGARLFVGRVYTSEPDWLAFLRSGASGLPSLINSGSAAVLFVPVNKRLLAVCFGHVHLVLSTDAFERQFGLRVVLNSVARKSIRSLDTATPDAVVVQRRVQASQDSDIGLFDIDVDRDLVSLVAGTPTDTAFARFLAGKDSLRLTCPLSAAGVLNKCKKAFGIYKSDAYKADYGWIDHVCAVREVDVIDKLDAKLEVALASLRAGKASDLHLAPPEIVDYMEGQAICYSGLGERGEEFTRLTIEDYVSELARCGFNGSIADIKAGHRISAKKDAGDLFSERWKVYDSFVFETRLDGGQYVMFAGEWFRLDRSFAADVEAFFKNLPRATIISSTKKSNEEELIADLASSRTDLAKLDRSKINPSGTRHANLEPCDFYSDKKEFIHLKDGHSSGPISHLWMQGVVSAEAFSTDAEYRKKIREHVKSIRSGFEKHLPDDTVKPVPSEYRVVFGIMREPLKAGRLDLPFFSKVSLRTAAKRIQALGYPVALNLIRKER